MNPCNERSESLLYKMGKGTQLTWCEEGSGIIFHCSYCDIVETLLELNKELELTSGMVTLSDFIDYIKMFTKSESSVEYPPAFDDMVLAHGWNLECFNCWDGLYVDCMYWSGFLNGQPVLYFRFMIPYCQDCFDCETCGGCDASLYKYKVAN